MVLIIDVIVMVGAYILQMPGMVLELWQMAAGFLAQNSCWLRQKTNKANLEYRKRGQR